MFPLILDIISSTMAFLLHATPVLALLFALINCVSAEVYYVGPTIGGILGLVSGSFSRNASIDSSGFV